MHNWTVSVILPIRAHLPSGAEMCFETNCQADVCAGRIQRVHQKNKEINRKTKTKKTPFALEWICGFAVLKKLICLRQGEKKVCENCFCPIPAAWEANLTLRRMGLVCKMHVRVKPIGHRKYSPTASSHAVKTNSASGPSWRHPPRRCSV